MVQASNVQYTVAVIFASIATICWIYLALDKMDILFTCFGLVFIGTVWYTVYRGRTKAPDDNRT